MAKLYLETTLFNWYFDDEGSGRNLETRALFDQIGEGKHQAYSSNVVLEKLNQAPEEKKKLMLGLLEKYAVDILQSDTVSERLAGIYIQKGIIPAKEEKDSLHIAVASVYEVDSLVSLNFKHIVRPKVEMAVNRVNQEEGFAAIEINEPQDYVGSLSEAHEYAHPLELEVDEWKRQSYEITKNMTVDQRVVYYRESARQALADVGYEFVIEDLCPSRNGRQRETEKTE